MTLRREIEARGDDLAETAGLHLRHLLRPLVDEQDEERGLGVVLHDPLGHRLQDRGLAGLRRRHDQRSLTLSERTKEVDHPVGVIAGTPASEPAVEDELFVRMNGAQPREVGPPSQLLRRLPIHRGNPRERRTLAPGGRLADLTRDLVSSPQAVATNQLTAHVDVAVRRQIAGITTPDEAGISVHQLEDAQRCRFDHLITSKK